MRISEPQRPVHGYGLFLYRSGDGDTCGFLDGSPVLVPTSIEKDQNRRRFRFSEGRRPLRTLGDIFCPDMQTAGFVREAINEKLQREREEKIERELDAANAFQVTRTNVTRRRLYLFVHVDVVFLASGKTDTFSFALEAPSRELREDAQREFGQLLRAVGLTEIEDSDELLGRTATLERRNEGVVFKRWVAA